MGAGARALPLAAVRAPSFVAATRSQLAALVTSPRAELSALVLNATLVFGGWFLLPRALRDWVFSVQGPLAFAIVLETWMLGDVISTNVLALHRAELVPLLHDAPALRRYFRARSAALALVVGTIGAVVTLVIAADLHRYVAAVSLALASFLMPIYVLGVTAWLGILFPYHPHPLSWRWRNRRPWLRTARWLVLRFVPYSVVAAMVSGLVGLLITVAIAVGGHTSGHRLSELGALAGALVACALAPVVWYLGTEAAARMTARRAVALAAYLNDPERG